MVDFTKLMMRKAKIEEGTQKIFCPECDESNFTVFRKEPLDGGKIYLHHAKCEGCSILFIFKVDSKGNVFVD